MHRATRGPGPTSGGGEHGHHYDIHPGGRRTNGDRGAGWVKASREAPAGFVGAAELLSNGLIALPVQFPCAGGPAHNRGRGETTVRSASERRLWSGCPASALTRSVHACTGCSGSVPLAAGIYSARPGTPGRRLGVTSAGRYVVGRERLIAPSRRGEWGWVLLAVAYRCADVIGR